MKKPPQSAESEKYVLGSLFITSKTTESDRVFAMLKPADFFTNDYRHVYSAMRELHELGNGIDVATVARKLERLTIDHQQGAVAMLVDLMDANVSDANMLYHAAEVKRYSLLRDSITGMHDIQQLAYNGETKSDAIIYRLADLSDRMNLERRRAAGIDNDGSMVTAMADVLIHLETLATGTSGAIPTPWVTLNNILKGGLQRGCVALVSALTGRGKSWFVYQMALHSAKNGIVTGLVNSEMRRVDGMARLAAICDGNIHLANSSSYDAMMTVYGYRDQFESLPLTFTPPASRTPDDVTLEVETLSKTGVKVVVVDNLSDIADNRPPYEWQPIFVRRCDDIAKKYENLIIAVTHLKEDGQKQVSLMNSKRLETVVSYHISVEPYGKNKTCDIMTTNGTMPIEINATMNIRKSRFSPSGMAIGCYFNDFGYVGFHDLGIIC